MAGRLAAYYPWCELAIYFHCMDRNIRYGSMAIVRVSVRLLIGLLVVTLTVFTPYVDQDNAGDALVPFVSVIIGKQVVSRRS